MTKIGKLQVGGFAIEDTRGTEQAVTRAISLESLKIIEEVNKVEDPGSDGTISDITTLDIANKI